MKKSVNKFNKFLKIKNKMCINKIELNKILKY